MRFLTAFILASSLGFPCLLHAETFEVGGKKIEIPPPAGYVRVTPEMSEVQRLFAQLIDPDNDMLAVYIAEASAPAARAGELPELERYFVLKVNKKLKSKKITPKEFAKISSYVVTHNNEIVKEIQNRLPSYLDQISQNLSKEYDTEIALKISPMIPLAPHHNSANAFAYSMFIGYELEEGQENASTTTPATVTSLNASGKLLFLYTYGNAQDLEWTRTAADSWHTAILAENPPPPQGGLGDLAQKVLPGIAGTLVVWGVITLIRRKTGKQ